MHIVGDVCYLYKRTNQDEREPEKHTSRYSERTLDRDPERERERERERARAHACVRRGGGAEEDRTRGIQRSICKG